MNPWHHGCLISCLDEVIWHLSSAPFTYSSPAEFISYSCVTKYHGFSNLRQHIFIISQFPGVRNLDIGLNQVLFLGLTKLKSGCRLGCILLWRFHWEEFASRLIQAGRIHFLEEVLWRAQTPFWLLARSLPWFPVTSLLSTATCFSRTTRRISIQTAKMEYCVM